MKSILRGLQLFCLLSLACPILRAQTPEDALEEMATSDKAEVVLKHLPPAVQKALDALTPQEKAKVVDKLLPVKFLARENVKLTKSEDGSWEAATPDGGGAIIRIQKTFLSGADALVMVRAGEKPKVPAGAAQGDAATDHFPQQSAPGRRDALIFLVMRMDDGEWRLINVGAAMEQQNLESEEFAKALIREGRGSGHGEMPGAAMMRTLITCMIAYSTSYPAVGYPERIQALSGPKEAQPSPEHAMLLDPSFFDDPPIRDGYEYHYTRVASDRFRLTGMPVEYGKAGTVSFFADETGVIRSTTENRTPNENDKPLD